MYHVQNFFGKKSPNFDALLDKWRKEIRRELRTIDRQLLNIQREENKIKTTIKQLAKKDGINKVIFLVKELVRSRKVKDSLYTSKTKLDSILMHLQQNLRSYKLYGITQSSTEILKVMNDLVNVPQIHENMIKLAKEMEKCGIIEEVINETVFDATEDFEEEVDQEVKNVLAELEQEIKEALPEPFKETEQSSTVPDINQLETQLMRDRLNALKGPN